MPNEKLHIAAIGAAPTSLGFAYRLNELLQEGNEKAQRIKLSILEQVGIVVPESFKSFS